MTFDEHEKVQGVPKKKCELLLVIVAVIHTFLGDTLYIMVEKRDGAKIC